MNSGAGVEFRGVTKRFGGRAAPLVVKGVDLLLPRGALTTILGPSGCGKTTLLRMIAGLESPTSGRILIDGVDVTEVGASERQVSMVFQSYALFPHMTVAQNVQYGLEVKRIALGERAQRVAQALQSVGLSGLEARMPGELSGGQQQRVALARSLVLEPSVLLFDEPLSNLDARLRRTMRNEIRQLQQRLGLTVAYVTHDQSEALAVSDQVVIMNAGRVAQTGSPRQLYDQPADAFVAGFMGEAVMLDAHADAGGRIEVGMLRLTATRNAPEPGPIRLAVRPENWRWCAGLPPDEAWIAAEVTSVAYLGSHLEVMVQSALGLLLLLEPDVNRLPAAGDQVSITPAFYTIAPFEPSASI